MKTLKISVLALVLFAGFSFAQSKWAIDKSHTSIGFSVSHLVISEVQGYFKSFEGTATSPKDNDWTNATIEFSADVNSINTENQKRDDHLKSDDFFNAAKYPKMTFKSTSVKKTGKDKYDITGDLTIRDVTKRVTLKAVFKGNATAWGTTKAGFTLTTKINRFDYNLKWNTLMEAGGAVVGKEVSITCQVELDKQVEAKK